MKATQLVVVSALAFGLQGFAHASPFPADAEASYHLRPLDTYADQQDRPGQSGATWGVAKRQLQPHDPFPFGGGYVDD